MNDNQAQLVLLPKMGVVCKNTREYRLMGVVFYVDSDANSAKVVAVFHIFSRLSFLRWSFYSQIIALTLAQNRMKLRQRTG